ncbi:phosphatidylethanolamine-binding protein [Streptomyces agglomeratus]|uniref:Phosphatidylethanolamine-binding protein n=1 Tax=Streptomyces agglomeratus TaxID=285458 RepID=A0A1E5PFW2_9ACTN|nr:YbhB/YbcL family Raf kinase inhibitor-like protein [Streptomyces agglomeratus]OEJ28422.1 phosphatidylethanolamine-binding protein [Streptomyces agglomeratus]OEJ37516.1 phosphatidylethanolamine-binding protein [Streptomyces agglomeratus]OEJ48100.1 phosphatidylethanolamine-binding protein [Streptomyces agglomeratus]OEJ50057.1 phosphatidylethanolamine-binding protein [Streptomyces agglomeratus]OEJ57384.1 phosphatidylethanolamine-binding protein [Streptomyces agglomeratus]
MAGIELKSSAFDDGAFVPRRYAKDGDDVSPGLSWSGVPEGASELLLLCEDPDAPSGTFVHWLVTGIDPASRGVEPGQSPEGGQARQNGFGESGWGGPLPPPGDKAHRYFFRLYALSGPVDLADDASAEDVHAAVDERQLATGTLVGLYQR